MTENNDKIDNMTVRRFAKLIKGNSTSNGSTGITTGTVIQNDNQLFVAVDDETLVPVSDTASNVKVGDKVTLAIDNEEALIVGNNSDASPTASELSETDTKATFAKVDASEAKDTAQTAQNTADSAQSTATEAQSTAQTAKETADAVDGKATEAKETATQAQATATTASETATQAKETAEAVDAKATEAQTTATEANTKATEAQSTATTAQTTANTAKETADTASTKADNAQSTADTANTKADNAQSTADTASSKADTAQASADDAKKVATNYIDFDETNGLVIGDKRDGATLTANTQINSEGVHIRDGETVLASFEDDTISLGNNSENAIISMCNNMAQMTYSKDSGFSLNTKTATPTEDYSRVITLDPGGKTGTMGIATGNISVSRGVFLSNQSVSQLAKGISSSSVITNTTSNISLTAKSTNRDDLTSYTNQSEFSETPNSFIMNVTSKTFTPQSGVSTKEKELKLTSLALTLDDTPVSLEGHTHKASDISGADGFALKDHTHTTSDLTDADTLSKTGHTHTQSDITDFAHTHVKDDITDFAHTHVKDDITDFAHTHTKSDITDFSHSHTKSEITDFAHNHAGDALTPASINTTSTIKQNGTQVSLQGHTHEADDLTTSTPIFYLKTLSQTYTCNKASNVAINFTIPAITGYTCVGCVDWQFSNASILTRWNFAWSTKLWSLYAYNVGSSTVSGTAKVKLLYVKSGWISCS